MTTLVLNPKKEKEENTIIKNWMIFGNA